MWAEARKHDQSLKRMMADHKRQFEKRQERLEKLKKNPINYLCISGLKCKLHYDPVAANMIESAHNMMPFMGDASNLIDRFDVRANLDHIDEYAGDETQIFEDDDEERSCNYERYRAIVRNSASNTTEENALKQIESDEFRAIIERGRRAADTAAKGGKSKPVQPVAIPFSYDEDSSKRPDSANATTTLNRESNDKRRTQAKTADSDAEADATDSEDEELFRLDIDIDALSSEQLASMNRAAVAYGLPFGEFTRFLREDKKIADQRKLAKLCELEKAADSSRKRIDFAKLRDANYVPAYALDESTRAKPSKQVDSSSSSDSDSESYSASRSKSKQKPKSKRKASESDDEHIEFITTFGEEEPEPSLKLGTNRRTGSSNVNVSSNGTSAAAPATASRHSGSQPTAAAHSEKNVAVKRTEFDRSRSTRGGRPNYRAARSSSESDRESTGRRSSSRERRPKRRSRSCSASPKRRDLREPHMRRDADRSRSMRGRRSSTRSRSRSPRRYRRQEERDGKFRRTRDSRSRSRSKQTRRHSRSPARSSSSSTSPRRRSPPAKRRVEKTDGSLSAAKKSDEPKQSASNSLRNTQTHSELPAAATAAAFAAALPPPLSAAKAPENIAPLKRYRRVDLEKEDEDALRLSSDDETTAAQPAPAEMLPFTPRGAEKKASASVLKVAELLRRKTETSIAKSFKAQQHAEREKQRKLEREQLERDAVMRRRHKAQREQQDRRERRRHASDRDDDDGDEFDSQAYASRRRRHSSSRSRSRNTSTSS